MKLLWAGEYARILSVPCNNVGKKEMTWPIIMFGPGCKIQMIDHSTEFIMGEDVRAINFAPQMC